MADDDKKKGESPIELFWKVLGVMAILVALWFYTGAYKHADIKGIFISPPPPVGPGGSYGPEIGNPNSYPNTGADVTP